MNFRIPSGLSPNDTRELLNMQLAGLASFGGVCGNVYYVNPATGDDDNTGADWAHPLATMEAALATVSDGDTIYFRGTVSEHGLTLATNNVTIVGALPSCGANVWQQASAANASLLTITGTGCRLVNIKFRPMGYDGSSARGLTLNGANYLQIIGCRFQGRASSRAAIYVSSGDNVLIDGCEFIYNNTATYGAGIVDGSVVGTDMSGWIIRNCRFSSNVTHVAVQLKYSLIIGNYFADYGLGPSGSDIQTTVHLDLSGASSGSNVVTGNFMAGDYSTASSSYVAGTNDTWYGNIAEDTSEGEVTALEVSTAVPAA